MGIRSSLVLSLVFLSGFTSQGAELSFSLDQSKTNGNELHFVAPSGHHFNSEAPNKVQVKIDSSWKDSDKIKIDGAKLTVTWAQIEDFCQGLNATLYVCDDKNSYCVPLRQSYACANNQLVLQENASIPEAATAVSSLDKKEDSLFILNDPEKALKQAKDEHKPLLIDFFAIWCPPCNQLDEEIFGSADFEKMASHFVLLKLDADAPPSWSLKSKFIITGYPTVIFTNENGEETNRLIGFREKPFFVAAMKRALTGKSASFEQNKLEADEKHNFKAAFEVGLTYLDRQEYAAANYYLYKASRSWSLSDIRRNKLLSSILGLHSNAQTPEDKKIYEHFLMSALEWYPRQEEVFDRADDLAKLAEDLGDKDAETKAHEILISTALWYLSHPKALRQTDNSRGDLYETLGETYEAIDDKDKAKDAFEKGAAEYLKEINKAKLNPDTERGFNLERVYCLWKGGHVEDAELIYSKLEKLYPSEFTFYYQHGRLLNEAKDYKRAEDEALKAHQYSYGDNKLRATGLLAEVYKNEGQEKKALEVLDDTINHFQLPGDKNIRTHRYFDKLVQLRKTI